MLVTTTCFIIAFTFLRIILLNLSLSLGHGATIGGLLTIGLFYLAIGWISSFVTILFLFLALLRLLIALILKSKRLLLELKYDRVGLLFKDFIDVLGAALQRRLHILGALA